MKIVKFLNQVLISLILIFSIFFIVGVSYSFFTSGISGAETDTTVTIETGDMKVVYLSGPDITALNMEPSEDPFATKEFTLTGTNTFENHEIWYELSIKVDENTFTTDAISYTLEGVTDEENGKMVADVLTRQPINNTDIQLGRGNFTGSVEGAVHTYTLKIYFYETWLDQSEDLGKIFKAHIGIGEYTPLPLNNYLMTLAGTDQGTGKLLNENGYRYEGLNPNNYVRFNNELWRIIGVFDDYTHGKTGQNLVKIIRSSSIGNYNYNTASSSNWNTASLRTYLNGTYYNGIQATSKSLIQNVTWKHGWGNYNLASSAHYLQERNSTDKIDADVGIIFPTDYTYASLATTCPRTVTLRWYKSSGCYNQNWLFNGGNHWTNFRAGGTSQVYYVYYSGELDSGGTVYGQYQRKTFPVVYLKETTLKMDGDGSSSNPYIIE